MTDLPTFAEAAELVSVACYATGQFPEKPALEGIWVDPAARVVATDGHRMFACYYAGPAPKAGFIMPADCRSLAKAKRIEAEFPDVQRVIPREPLPYLSGPADYLLSEVKRFCKAASLTKKDPIYLYRGDFGEARIATREFRSDDGPVGSLGLNKADKMAGSFKAAFNSRYLLDMMEACASFGDVFRFRCPDEFSPLVLEVGPMLTLTMPTRL